MTEKTDIAVSISVLTFNHEAYLRKALEGLAMQKTDFPFEVIIHDDASLDNTPAVIREYEAAFPVIRPIYQTENQFSKTGKYPTVNTYSAARGRYIAICDGDDYWGDPLKLQKQVDYMEAHPEAILCYHDYVFLQEGIYSEPSSEEPCNYTADELVAFPLTGYGMSPCTWLFRNLYKEEDRKVWEDFAGDYPTKVLLGTFNRGGAHYIPGIKPSVKRKHAGSSWCALPREEIQKRTEAMHEYLVDLIYARGNPRHIELREGFCNG